MEVQGAFQACSIIKMHKYAEVLEKLGYCPIKLFSIQNLTRELQMQEANIFKRYVHTMEIIQRLKLLSI